MKKNPINPAWGQAARRVGCGIVGLRLLTIVSVQAQDQIGVPVPTGSTRNDTYVGAGFEFYPPTAGSTINALGYWDASGTGLIQPHTVTVFQYAGYASAYNQLVTATIPAGTAAPLINGYRWVSIPSTTLPNIGQGGGYYAVIAEDCIDTWADSIAAAPYMDPAIGAVSGYGIILEGATVSVLSSSLNLGGDGNPGDGYGGPNVGLLTETLPASATPSLITWDQTGTFVDDTVLAMAGAASSEVYGVDFGGSGLQTTTNGYTFNDYQTTGYATLGSGGTDYNNYLGGGGTTGDGAMDTILNYGVYSGSASLTCVLNNLTVGQKYKVLALCADTRSAGADVQFQETEFLSYSPAQTFGFNSGSPAIGGYILGTFTAVATNQIFTMLSPQTHYQYNAILLTKWTPPVYPPIVIISNPQPSTVVAGIGDKVTFTAVVSNSPAVNLQWEFVANGTTNNISAGVASVTNNNAITTTLTLSNLQAAASGQYQILAVDATNNLNFKYSTAAALAVIPLINWIQWGQVSNNSVLSLVGSPTNEAYGVDFGAGSQTTVNGYSFADYTLGSSGMKIAGAYSQYGNYLGGGGTSGDPAFDAIIDNGIYGSGSANPNPGTLLNLTPGQNYYVLVILGDTRNSYTRGSHFYCTEGVYNSPNQEEVYTGGTPAIGGYMLGTFTATSTNQPLSVVQQDTSGNYDQSQYQAVLVATAPPPQYPPIYVTSQPAPAQLTVPEGSRVQFTASFRNSPAVTLQWQSVINGVTSGITSGVVTSNSGAVVSTTLTLSNVSLSASGNYQVKATAATNSLDIAYSGAAALTVLPIIHWTASGQFSSDSVLALVGSPANVLYAADFGGSGTQTTANGYMFNDAATSDDVTLAGNPSAFGSYMTGGASTGDPALDTILTYGNYDGISDTGTLNNLTPGQTYKLLVLLDDTRGGAAGGAYFTVNDGVTNSPTPQYAFTNGSPSVGGYLLGQFRATGTNQALSVFTSYAANASIYFSSQYNAVVVATTPLAFAAPYLSNGNMILTATGGSPGGHYTLLQTTNLKPPIAWTTNSTGTLDGAGSLSNAVPVSASQPAVFFQVRLP